MKNKNKKNIYIEILRIIAILMVIGTHIKFPWLDGDNISKLRLLISCFVCDGVAIFWFIMGMNCFKKTPYKERLKKLWKRIIIPLIIFSVIGFYFYDFYALGVPLKESIHHTGSEYLYLLKDGIMQFQNVILGVGHFWYLYIYILIVLLLPLLEKIKEFLDQYDDKKVIGILILMMFVNDLSLNKLLELSFHALNGVLAALFFLYTGYLLYKNEKEIQNKKKTAIISLLIVIVTGILRAIIIYKGVPLDNNTQYLIRWWTSFSLINTISIYYFVRSAFSFVEKKERINKIICHLGSQVFYIYLVHYFIKDFLIGKEFHLKVLGLLHNNVILYTILYTLLVFTISLIISECITFLKKVCYNKVGDKK